MAGVGSEEGQLATYRIKIEGRSEYDESRLLRDAWIRWQAQQRELPEEREQEQARCRDLARNQPSVVGGPARGRCTTAGGVDDDGEAPIGECGREVTPEDQCARPGWRAINQAGGLDEYLAEREDREALRCFLRLLFVHSPAQWEAVDMCLLDGMSEPSTGCHLGITHQAVHFRVGGAARHIKRALDDVRLARRIIWRHAPRLVEEWAISRLWEDVEKADDLQDHTNDGEG